MTDNEFHSLLSSVQKPGRYCGGELNSVVKDKNSVDVRFAFCFPDTYEIGMSHLGIKILYGLMNSLDWCWCERVFAPCDDMEAAMRKADVPLFGLESRDPIRKFDFVGFTVQYELCYTNILNMLDLAGIPILSSDRGENDPIVVAGGPCVCNGEPIVDFIDIFCVGEGEEMNIEMLELYRKYKSEGMSRRDFIKAAAGIEGLYVPALYTPVYGEDGTLSDFVPAEGAPNRVKKRIVKNLDTMYYPDKFPVPFIEIVHDRAVEELFRGCIRGCRFCQACFIYRPVREKSPQVAGRQAHDLCASTGYDEVSLSSLSTSDYTGLGDLLTDMLDWTDREKINISLPSLRIDNFSGELLEKLQSVRKSGLTFAPEAGTQRMRDVINKNVTEDEIMRACAEAFRGGRTSVKLYFMIGLPGETDEDVVGIVELAQRVVDLFYSMPERPKGRGVQVSVSVASFVPKPFTPFEFEPQDTAEELKRKQALLLSSVHSKKIMISYHSPATSLLEGAFARGDRRLCSVLLEAWRSGCVFDSWSEHFDPQKWSDAFSRCGVDPLFFSSRRREYDELFPWDFLDYGLSKAFFVRENKKALEGITTPNCREKCAGCGANSLCREACKNA